MIQQPGTPKPEAKAARSTCVRVRYADTDRMGVVYYSNYLVWFEVGRTEWLRETGWSYREMEVDGVSLPVIEAHCEYRQPARYDDEIEIVTRATLLTPVRIRFDYDIVRRRDETLAAVGYTVHAALDPSGRPRRLPDRVRSLLS
jgi:acyl-CoA thioester hydrolase